MPAHSFRACLATVNIVSSVSGTVPIQKSTLERVSVLTGSVQLADSRAMTTKFRKGSAKELRCSGWLNSFQTCKLAPIKCPRGGRGKAAKFVSWC